MQYEDVTGERALRYEVFVTAACACYQAKPAWRLSNLASVSLDLTDCCEHLQVIVLKKSCLYASSPVHTRAGRTTVRSLYVRVVCVPPPLAFCLRIIANSQFRRFYDENATK